MYSALSHLGAVGTSGEHARSSNHGSIVSKVGLALVGAKIT
jgi:hypothetical protein